MRGSGAAQSNGLNLPIQNGCFAAADPLHPNGDIDPGSLRRVVDLFIQAGVDGVRSISEVGRKR